MVKWADAVRGIQREQGIRASALAHRLGIGESAMYQRYTQGNVTTGLLVPMLGAMDYKLVAVPRETRMASGWYEVE